MINLVVNDLLDYDLKIFQDNNFFKFSLDSVMLAEFVRIDLKDKKLLDLCTGNAPLPLILAPKILHITAFELQTEVFKLALEGVKHNSVDNITLINDNIKNIGNYFPGNNYDIVTCNPPYFKYSKNSIINENREKAIARHEIEINLKEIVDIAYENLREKGKFYLVHRTNRLLEICSCLEERGFGIKTIQFIYANETAECSMFLVESKKNTKSDIRVLNPIFTDRYRR